MSLPKNDDRSKTNSRSVPNARGGTRADVATIDPQTTTCSILTGVGRSAIAVIELHGPSAEALLTACFTPVTKAAFLPNQIRYGVWHGADSDSDSTAAGESVVVTPICLSGSSTAETAHFEVHCHGGPAATERIIHHAQSMGAVLIPPSASPCLLIQEAAEVLSRCTTSRTAAIAADQFRGAMQNWTINALLELESKAGSLADIRHQAAELQRFAPFTVRMTEPYRVVLTGPPNVGKSSLLNAIVGYDRSIALDVAGTTRDVLHAETVLDGLPIRLSDTAGIRESSEPIEKEGISRARHAISDADLILQISEPGLKEDSAYPQQEPGLLPVLQVLNKSDLLPQNSAARFQSYLHTNALSGQGIEDLMSAIVKALSHSMPDAGMPVPINQRQADLLAGIAEDHAKDIPAKLTELLGRR
ncbi:MAG: GTPase [Rubripirellula sp.]